MPAWVWMWRFGPLRRLVTIDRVNVGAGGQTLTTVRGRSHAERGEQMADTDRRADLARNFTHAVTIVAGIPV
jgi:hypothetical protein